MITHRTPLIEIEPDPARIRQAAVANALWAKDLRAADEETEPILRTLLGNPGRYNGHPVPWDLAHAYTAPKPGQPSKGVSTCGLVGAGLLKRLIGLPWDGYWYREAPPPYRGLDIVSCLSQLGQGLRTSGHARPGDVGCIGSGMATHIYSATGWDGEYLLSIDGGQVDSIKEDPAGRYLQRTRQCRRLWSGMQRVWTIDLELLAVRYPRRSWLVPEGWDEVQLVEAPTVAPVAYQLGTTKGVQAALNALGYRPELAVDGWYGAKSRAAVMAFQLQAGLRVDGVVGRMTRAALAQALAG